MKYRRLVDDYTKRWPNHCGTCGGGGGHYWGQYSLAPDDSGYDPCPECWGKGKCPRCGAGGQFSVGHEDDPCASCGWTTKDEGLPDPDGCTCPDGIPPPAPAPEPGALSEERLTEFEAIERAARPGPWRWFGNAGTQDIYLATAGGGRVFVMNFVRWGMSGAQPRFQSDRHLMVKASDFLVYEVPYRKDIVGIDHPDAVFLERSREMVTALLAEVRRLRASPSAREEQGAGTCDACGGSGKVGTGTPSGEGGEDFDRCPDCAGAGTKEGE